MAVLNGLFEIEDQSPFDEPNIRAAVAWAVGEGMTGKSSSHKWKARKILDLAKLAVRTTRRRHPGLNSGDSLLVQWPIQSGLEVGQSRSIIRDGIGSMVPKFGAERTIAACAYDDFLKVKDFDACATFAMNWGLLDDWHARSRTYKPSDSTERGQRISLAQALYRVGMLNGESAALKQGLKGAVLGEPLDAWLWHPSRLSTWHTVLGSSNYSRQLRILNRAVDLLKVPQPGQSPASGKLQDGWYVPHLAKELVRSTTDAEVEAVSSWQPWQYAVHQEGEFMRFAHPKFEEIRACSGRKLDVRFGSAVVRLMRTLLQEALEGKVSFQLISKGGRPSVQPSSLLAWLYLEFANRHMEILEGTVRSVPCASPGCQKMAEWHRRGRPRLYCSNSCRTNANKKRRAAESPTDQG